jgi:hypothetical protein
MLINIFKNTFSILKKNSFATAALLLCCACGDILQVLPKPKYNKMKPGRLYGHVRNKSGATVAAPSGYDLVPVVYYECVKNPGKGSDTFAMRICNEKGETIYGIGNIPSDWRKKEAESAKDILDKINLNTLKSNLKKSGIAKKELECIGLFRYLEAMYNADPNSTNLEAQIPHKDYVKKGWTN